MGRQRLTIGVIGITAALLAALAATLLTYGRSESHWRDTLPWDRAVTGASQQIAGISEQRAAQAQYAATGDRRYKLAFERGVRRAANGSRAIVAVGERGITAITTRAEAADVRHDQVVRTRLFPAIARHDRAATVTALAQAERLIDVVNGLAVQLDGRLRSLRATDIREAKSSEHVATIVGLVALALALLTGIGGTAIVMQAQRRRHRAHTEREHLLELTRTQNAELRRLDEEKDAFIAAVSHELRTPLTSIRGYTELVGDDTNLTEEQLHFLSIVDRNAARLLRLINDLLLAAQIDAVGELEIDRDEVDLRPLASHAVESAGPAASIKDIQLRLLADGPLIVMGDELRLAQVIDNLLSNAVKFTPNGGRVTVRLSPADGSAQLEVTDTGMGMSAEEQSRLFERFYRTEGATKGAVQGSGLGLAIAQAIAHAHGGTIAVQSEQGAGSTFTLRVPMFERDLTSAAVNRPPGLDAGEGRSVE